LLIREYPQVLQLVETRLGQLQRGLGRGMIAALACESEAELESLSIELAYCVLNEPRMSSQLEDRSEYFAEIYHRSGASLRPLLDVLLTRCAFPEAYSDDWRFVHFFEALLRVGSREAELALRELIGNRFHFYAALVPLNAFGAERARVIMPIRLVLAWVEAQSYEELVESILAGSEGPRVSWEFWADDIALLQQAWDDALAREEADREGALMRCDRDSPHPKPPRIESPSEAEIAALSTSEMLSRANALSFDWAIIELRQRARDEALRDEVVAACRAHLDHPAVRLRGAIIETLGRLRVLDVQEAIVARLLEIVERHPGIGDYEKFDFALPWSVVIELRFKMRALVSYFDWLDHPSTLVYARAWIDEGHPLGSIAQRCFARHGEPCDAERVGAVWRRKLARDPSGDEATWWFEAALRCGYPRSVEIALDTFASMCYSPARCATLVDLIEYGHSRECPDFLVEALWDCEARTRVLAIQHVLIDVPGVRERIEQIANSPSYWDEAESNEDERVCAAARERLGLPV